MIFSRLFKKSRAPKEAIKPGSYRFSIAGSGYYVKAIKSFTGGSGGEYDGTAQLRAEPDNKYDPDAIQVVVNKKVVGYIPRESTSEVRKLWPYIDSIDVHLKHIDNSDINLRESAAGHISINILP